MRILLVVMLTLVSAHAGMWSAVAGMTLDEKKPDAQYTVDTFGNNPRVYEFTPVGAPNIVCIALFSSTDKSSAPAMQCVPKR